MQAEKYVGRAFNYTGIFEVEKIEGEIFLVKLGEFTDKTWTNNHPEIQEINGVKVLGINRANFEFIRKLSSLELELY